ncbi:hypothetical protein [Oceanobacillus sojae]|uniref:hypothetical protein n=1 Tax=Oceanobacillus sojae TaxID=582851 RepID=UPI0009883F42|nr:hypothetical protein [Oceanobacillus sojae]
MCENGKDNKGDEDMAVMEDVKIDAKQSINNSLDEVEQIRKGTLPKRSYKEMIARIREKLSEESK